MGDGFRWIGDRGEPCSPRHRTPETAARWLMRQARRPRVADRPQLLMVEIDRGQPGFAALIRLPLESGERQRLLAEVARIGGKPPISADGWLRRQAAIVAARHRRRASLGLLTRPMVARRSGKGER